MSDLVLKVKMKTGELIVRGLKSNQTVSELKKVLAKLTHIGSADLNALKGFPPKPLNLRCGGASLEAIGIRNGDTLIIEEVKKASLQDSKDPYTKHQDLSVGSLTIAEGPSSSVLAEMNEEPRIGGTNMIASMILYRSSIMHLGTTTGVIRKQNIPADNSCLFTSIGFTLTGVVDTSCGKNMRAIVSDVIKNRPSQYSEAMLGRPNEQYCSWILEPESWGGGIELSILSNYFGFEIAVINLVSGNISLFGEDRNYKNRAYLIFDGAHYDSLYLEPREPGSQPIQTIFASNDEVIRAEVEKFAQAAKEKRAFVSANLKIMCSDCQTPLADQETALKHAARTGHCNFREMK